MPLYQYFCTNCEQTTEEFHPMFDAPLTMCPSCNSNTLVREITAPHVYVKKSDNELTVGQLADRNRNRFSDDYKCHIDTKDGIERNKKLEKKPSFLDKYQTATEREIKKMTDKQKENYIKTGEK